MWPFHLFAILRMQRTERAGGDHVLRLYETHEDSRASAVEFVAKTARGERWAWLADDHWKYFDALEILGLPHGGLRVGHLS